jgi:hypothetical protein
MKTKLSFWLLLCCFFYGNQIQAQNQKPIIANLQMSNNVADKVLTLTFDLQDPEDLNIEVLLKASFDAGANFLVNTDNTTGDIGFPVAVGNNKTIEWYYGDYWDNVMGKTLRLVADDRFEIDLEELVNQVDSNRLKSMLNFISAPRSFNVAPEHLAAVRDTLKTRLENYNYAVKLQPFDFEGNNANNVIGRKAGLKEERNTVIMDAHYDAYNFAPGADDNGSGVVGFMEAARILSQYDFDKSIEFIGFDQEENYLLGSINYAFFGGIEPWKIVEGVLNFEMIGYFSNEPYSQIFPTGFDLLFPSQYETLVNDDFRGNFIFLVGNDASIHLVNAFENAAEMYVPEMKVISGIVPLNGLIAPDLLRSDHAPFWFRGIPGLMITDGAEFRNSDYHTTNDVVANLDFDFMANVTKTCMATMAELAGINHASVKTFVVEEEVATALNDNKKCEVLLYPNPVSDFLHLQMGSCLKADQIITAKIYDSKGQFVQSHLLTQPQSQLRLNNMPCGAYVLELSDNVNSFSYPFMVQ